MGRQFFGDFISVDGEKKNRQGDPGGGEGELETNVKPSSAPQGIMFATHGTEKYTQNGKQKHMWGGDLGWKRA